MKNKKLVSYSESFIFRARCKVCWSKPCGKVYNAPGPGLGLSTHFDFFKKQICKRSPFIINPPHLNFLGDLSKGGICYYGSFSPRSFSKEKNKSYYRTMACACGLTWWIFKENSPQRSIKFVKPQ